jgi:hypothetical protein
LAIVAACGGPATEAGAGEPCFRVSDCQLGLVCGPDRKCTDDLSSIDIRPDASAGAPGTGGGNAADSSATPDSVTTTGMGGSTGVGGSTGAGGGNGTPSNDAASADESGD